LIPYLGKLQYSIPKYANPTDFCFEILRKHEDMLRNTRFNPENYKTLIEPLIEQEKAHLSDSAFHLFKKENTFLYETIQIMKRGYLNFTRNPLLFRGKFITNSIF